ncbi:unnamed protein product [Polarella glacialis]|uniref:Apple domain-containing protein n=1 Tax=Polarella glacialis TaxID=89957 RepID=A0A813I4Z7_POLGL|nr:unnamed protein product [Polarella glacialis]
MPLQRLRVSDNTGSLGWPGEELESKQDAGGSDARHHEFSCRVPWWVWQISLSGEDAPRKDVALAIGENEVWMDFSKPSGSETVAERQVEGLSQSLIRAFREDPLRQLLPRLRPYEASQLSVGTFLVLLVGVVRTGVPVLLAAPLLAVIPLSRVCPELPWLLLKLRSGEGVEPGADMPSESSSRSSARSGGQPPGRRGLTAAAACLVAVWVALVLLSWTKSHYSTMSSQEKSPVDWKPPPAVRPQQRPSPPPPRSRGPAESQSTQQADFWAPVDVDWEPIPMAPCFFSQAKFEPLDMPGHGRTIARTANECQARCARTPGCAHFTLLPTSQAGRAGSMSYHCHLQEYRAQMVAGPHESVAGPSDCGQEAMLAELLGDTQPRRGSPAEEASPDAFDNHVEAPDPGLTAAAPPPQRPSGLADKEPAQAEARDRWVPAPPAATKRKPVPDLPAEGSLWILLMLVIITCGLAVSGLLDVPR